MTIPRQILDRLVSIRVKPGRLGEDSWVTIERRDGFADFKTFTGHKTRWAVCDANLCMSKTGEWDWEPMPSSRTNEFWDNFRFDTFQEAWDAAMRFPVYAYRTTSTPGSAD